jgi:hypothetical protein
MRRMVRAPLAWMVIGEVMVVGALIAVAWHALAGATSSSAAAPLLFPPVAASPADSALPGAGVPVAEGSTRGPAPGLNLGVGFWRLRLGSLNRDEAAFEALEWRITHAVMNAARDYIETVVLPAVKRAEGGVA